jgi:hypothetical protein
LINLQITLALNETKRIVNNKLAKYIFTREYIILMPLIYNIYKNNNSRMRLNITLNTKSFEIYQNIL